MVFEHLFQVLRFLASRLRYPIWNDYHPFCLALLFLFFIFFFFFGGVVPQILRYIFFCGLGFWDCLVYGLR